MTAAVDWRGVEITPGVVVVYPVRSGSSMWMTEAVVVEVPEEGSLVVERFRTDRTPADRIGQRRVSLPAADLVTVLHPIAPPVDPPTEETR